MRARIAKNLQEDVVKTYDEIADEFDRTRRADWSEFEDFLRFIKDGEKLVDLGCGNGRFLDFIRKHREVEYLGIDNNKKFVEIAKSKYGEDLFLEGDMTKIPLGDEFCDVLCAIASFHHVPSQKLRLLALKETVRVLKSGGTLILSVWNLFQPKYKKYVIRAYFKWLISFGKFDLRDTFIPWGKSGIDRYYYAFKVKELRKLAEKSGLKVLEEKVGRNIIIICKKY